jgi:hypothetical protein
MNAGQLSHQDCSKVMSLRFDLGMLVVGKNAR